MLPDPPMSRYFQMPLYEFLKKYALKLEQNAELKRFCDNIAVTYLCTPFSLAAAKELEQIGAVCSACIDELRERVSTCL